MIDLDKSLARHFGFDAFRKGQREVVEAIVAGRDVLAVMPTGQGKSLCYQLPALLLDGTTVVVSPLIALMKDQVDALADRDIPATCINSSLSPSEQGVRLNQIARGEFKLVYIAPERFRDRRFGESLRESRIAFFAIDEAHCVSMWGHDFRPDYLRIGEAVEQMGRPPVAAFTATATPVVREDIERGLRLRDASVHVTGFERPNLSFKVIEANKDSEKTAWLGDLIERHQTGIIYCATRKKVQRVSEKLDDLQIHHVIYHGGMDEGSRTMAQDAFIRKEADVVVATNAFGMGIDRGDLRFIAHVEIPGSVEAYYQEAGRAGRDGLPSECVLLFGHRDREIQEFFIEGSNPSAETIIRVYRELARLADASHEVRLSIDDLTEAASERNPMAVSSALSMLARQRVIERFDIPGQRVRGTRLLQPSLRYAELPLDTTAMMEKLKRDRMKLDAMLSYARGIYSCRQQWILRYFGQQDAPPCGNCDLCRLVERRTGRNPAEVARGQAASADEQTEGGAAGKEPTQLATEGSEAATSTAAASEDVVPEIGPQTIGDLGLTDEQKLILRKALSGVARMSNRFHGRWQPRFGQVKIIQMLQGRNIKELRERGLDELSTFGLLKDFTDEFLRDLFREMLRAGLLVSEENDHYVKVTLSAHGESVMKDQAEPALLWPDAPMTPLENVDSSYKVDTKGAAAPSAERQRRSRRSPDETQTAEPSQPAFLDENGGNHTLDEELLDKLKQKRAELSRVQRVKPFQIFNNAVLEQLATIKPLTKEESLGIKGIGEVKARRTLPAFLRIIASHIAGDEP